MLLKIASLLGLIVIGAVGLLWFIEAGDEAKRGRQEEDEHRQLRGELRESERRRA